MVIAVSAAVFVLRHEWIFSIPIGEALLLFALMCAIYGVQGMKRYEVVMVVGRRGKTLYKIWHPRNGPVEFEKFIAALRSRIYDTDEAG